MLQLLRGTSEAVAASNPKLEAGQPFFELDTQKLKIGNGTSNYNDLLYIGGNSGGSSSCPFPINAVMIFTVNQNPNSIWSETTWELFGQGKTLIGLDTGDTDYNTALKTGGAKTISLSHTHSTSGHALTTSEMPSHSHSFGSHSHSMNHSHSDTFRVASHTHHIEGYSRSDYADGSHNHYIGYGSSFSNTKAVGLDSGSYTGVKIDFTIGGGINRAEGTLKAVADMGNYMDADLHRHWLDIDTESASPSLSGSVSSYSGSTGSASGSSGSTGSGSSHSHGNTGSALSTQSVLQPYVVVCFWQRTA